MTTEAPRDPRRTWLVVLVILGLVIAGTLFAGALVFDWFFRQVYHIA